MTASLNQAVVLRHPRLSRAELAGLLSKLVPAGASSWYLATRIDGHSFGRFVAAKAEATVAEWSDGRVFCAQLEFRWRRVAAAEHYDALLLTEDDSLRPDGFSPVGDRWDAMRPGDHTALQAWGSLVSGDAEKTVRGETRLPRRMVYPPDCNNGRLHCLYYKDPSGAVQFVRLLGAQ